MKYLRFLFALIIAISVSAVVIAQDDSIEFEAFESAAFGVQGIVPAGWQNPAPGTYARASSATDLTSVIVQSAVITQDVLLGVLSGQLGIAEFPEPESEATTGLGTWAIYRVEIETPVSVNVTVAITEIEGVTYLVLLQSTPEEHDMLRETVFMPVLDSITRLTSDEDTEMLDVPYIVEDVSFESGDITLAGTLTIPGDEGEFPVVVLVSGSGAQDRDESLLPIAEIKPFRDIADYLTRNGIAVLRYDDRGFAESTGDFAIADIYDFRDDANAAIDYLAERDEFSQIGIAGHSEGATYAPEIGITNDNVDFVVALAGATSRVVEVLPYQIQALATADGMDEEDAMALADMMLDLIEAYDNGEDEVFLDAIRELVIAQSGEEPSEQILELAVAQFTSPVFVSYFEYDPAPFWLDLDVPTLAVYGSLDLQVSAEQNIAVIDGMNDNITIVTIDNMNHIFQIAETGAISEYGGLEQMVLPELLETMTEWILEVTAQ